MNIEEISKYLPEDYGIVGYSLCRIRENSKDPNDDPVAEPLCNFVPYIERETVCDDGVEVRRRYLVGGYDKFGRALPFISVSESEFDKMEWPRKNWGMVCNIMPGFASAKHIRFALQETADGADKQDIFLTVGWKKINGEYHYLMPGDTRYTVELPGRLHGFGFNREENKENLKLIPKLLSSVAPRGRYVPAGCVRFSVAAESFPARSRRRTENDADAFR